MKIRRDNGQNSLERIHDVQTELKIIFPKSYINLIKNHDAVRFENNIFDFINIYNQQDERDLNFISFKLNHLDGEIISYQENLSDVNNYGIRDLIIFGICSNGDYICFDYRDNIKSAEPKIVLVYHDDFIDNDDGSSSMVVNKVTDNFDDLINSLRE